MRQNAPALGLCVCYVSLVCLRYGFLHDTCILKGAAYLTRRGTGANERLRRHWHAHQVPHRHYARSIKLARKLFVEPCALTVRDQYFSLGQANAFFVGLLSPENQRNQGHERPDECEVRVKRGGMEQHRNERARETGDPSENPPTSVIIRHDFHARKSGNEPSENRARFAWGVEFGDGYSSGDTHIPKWGPDPRESHFFYAYVWRMLNSRLHGSSILRRNDWKTDRVQGVYHQPMSVTEVWSSAGMKGRGKREILEKTFGPAASSNQSMKYVSLQYKVGNIVIHLSGPWWLSGWPAPLPPRRTRLNPWSGHSRIFAWGNSAGRCHWSPGFLEIIPFPSPCSKLTSIPLIGSQDHLASWTKRPESQIGGRSYWEIRFKDWFTTALFSLRLDTTTSYFQSKSFSLLMLLKGFRSVHSGKAGYARADPIQSANRRGRLYERTNPAAHPPVH
ncbi:hypothetical protein PR048_009682 [Dryococelus australis]|uniref:Uncharacterized protein n=1 Tax=Dryococelus australis TaxID=614101 RepID=A0ABQ9I0M3_9NEOP|nr:hypothetical protein PR048_009682 [Dryococelus australis]